MRGVISLAAASLFALALAGCGSGSDTSGASPAAVEAAKSAGPAQSIEQSAQFLRRGDIAAMMQVALPGEHYEKLKGEWAQRVKSEPASDSEKQEFAELMAKLTAADAEAVLFAELEPQLAKAEAEMGAQMPLMIGMGRGFAAQAISESDKLSAEQKAQTTQLLDAVAKWIETARFFDRDNARAAISQVVKTARSLDVTSLDQIEAMPFEDVVALGGKVFVGAQEVLKIYGLDVDAALGSVKAEVLNQSADAAKVKVSYTIFNQPLSFETDMVRRDDRWFGKDALVEIEKGMTGSDQVGSGN